MAKAVLEQANYEATIPDEIFEPDQPSKVAGFPLLHVLPRELKPKYRCLSLLAFSLCVERRLNASRENMRKRRTYDG